jgi:hypothetical protein
MSEELKNRKPGHYWILWIEKDEDQIKRQWGVAWFGTRAGDPEGGPFWFFPGRDGPYGRLEVEEQYVKAGYILKIADKPIPEPEVKS